MIEQTRDAFPIAQWWADVLRRDDQYVSAWHAHDNYEVELPDENPFLSCVFCWRSLEGDIRRGLKEPNWLGHMVAYWGPRTTFETLSNPPPWRIFAAGMYCVGRRDGCLCHADRVGLLLDNHVAYATGRNAWPYLEQRLFARQEWDPLALRRYVMILRELSKLPQSEVSKPRPVRAKGAAQS